MVRSFKKHVEKSDLALDDAVNEFLMTYRRTPLSCGRSPSELLNGRQIRADIDVLLPMSTTQQRQLKLSVQSTVNNVNPCGQAI